MSFHAPTLPIEIYGEANLRLGKIEAEENITIHFAVESGSRAWGFASPDSDLDVRFFYTRPLSCYVGLEPSKDTIERPIDGDWDLNGWDLGKALRLLIKGNATANEWLSSPLIYRQHGPTPYKLRDLIARHASPTASARHYYGLTKSCYAGEVANRPTAEENARNAAAGIQIKGLTTVNLKKYLYAIRGSASIAWVRRYNEVPPMSLPALMARDILPTEVRDELDKLMMRKATMGEMGYGDRIAPLDAWIEAQMGWVKENGMERYEPDPAFVAEANHLLLETLGIAS